jgi:hypothetical protein
MIKNCGPFESLTKKVDYSGIFLFESIVYVYVLVESTKLL